MEDSPGTALCRDTSPRTRSLGIRPRPRPPGPAPRHVGMRPRHRPGAMGNKRTSSSSSASSRSSTASSTASSSASSGWHGPLAAYGGVATLALGCYANGLHGEFVHDDIPAIVRNRDVLGQAPLHAVLGNDFWGTSMADPHSHKSWRPLTVLTFRASHAVWGLQPVWFHAVNVVLHLVASLLFTRVCVSVAGLRAAFATLAGLLFAAHPIHTEAVTGIVGRADVLACVFFLLSFLAYHDPGFGGRIGTSVVLAGVSMLAKETGVTVLGVNLLLDVYRSWGSLRRAVRDARWNEEAALFSRRAAKIVLSLSVLVVFRVALLQGTMPKFSQQDNPAAFHPCPQVRLLTFCYLAALNCWLLLCPATLSHDWQFGSVPLVASLADTRNLATCAFFGVGILVAYRCVVDLEIQRHPPLILGLLLLCIPFLPASNLLVTVGFVIAERVLYIPSLGMVLLVVYGLQLLWHAVLVRQRALLLGAALLVLGSFCLRTVVRNKDWTSRETLALSGVRDMPNNAKLHYNMGNAFRDTGRKPPAILHYKEALRLWPSYASAHNNLGTLAPSADEAERYFLSAIHFQPAHVNAHYNLGHVYKRENRTDEAIRMWERCISLDPQYASAYLWLAQLEGEHRAHRAGELLRALNLRSGPCPKHRAALAEWLLSKGRTLEALSWFERALRLDARYARAFLGALRALRALGQRGRLHQVTLRWMSLTASRPPRLYPAEMPASRHWGIILQTVTVSLKPALPALPALQRCGFGTPCPIGLEDRDSNKSRGQTRTSHGARRTTATSACASRTDGAACSAGHAATAKKKKKQSSKQKGAAPAPATPPATPPAGLVVGNILDTWHSACHSIGQACLH